ncbi:hypothetical protein SAMN04515667_2798 [Formosa sp. Hel1_31_208]|uniref:DUF922 domain-containing protein n=1 Tax=Formosa sp. Hel1_31_208 TaxID=1798225 RepID=UPI00087A93AD|nr:hypothetical protein [Formosa sp. Hel1_31_208]SDS71048.1 hypothetical protein SAMN04515667_2798 [Formosa sp. Hel1_31_208]
MGLRLLVLFFLLLNTASRDEVTITWNESKKLSWSDFKGNIDPNSDAVAVTASGITFSFSVQQANGRNVSFKANAEAHFYPEQSWYLSDSGNDHILAHEQLHFDITELHVRQLRYGIAQLKVSQNINEDLGELHQKTNADLAKMQHAYDTQTQNSIHMERQAIWSQFVKDELNKFRAYKSK